MTSDTEQLGNQRTTLREHAQRVLHHNPGEVARRLRIERGYTIKGLAERTRIVPKTLREFEKFGIVDWLDETRHEDGDDECEDDDRDQRRQKLPDRYIAVLEPTDKEERTLRRDRQGELSDAITALATFLGLEGRPPPDPWDKEPTPPKPRARTPRQLSTLPGCEPINDETPTCSGPTVRFKLQLVATTDTTEETFEVAELTKHYERIEHLGLTLSDSKGLLRDLQEHVVARQLAAAVELHGRCKQCGRRLGNKGHHTITLRTLFGSVRAPSPRFRRCASCGEKGTFSPLAEVLPERTTPELLYMESKWASLVSYELTARMLEDFLPVDEKINAATIRNHALRVAQRCEAELEDERIFFINGCRRDWDALPEPDGPITVGIDGGYLRAWHDRKVNFEVIVGKSVPANGSSKCFGLVQQYDEKPRRRMFETLRSQGMQMNQSVRFLSDGETSVRELQQYLSPKAEHVLDWFHIAMRWTRLRQFVRGIVAIEKKRGTYSFTSIAYDMQRDLDAAKWKLWHGKPHDATERLQSALELAYNFEDSYPRFSKLRAAFQEMITYVRRNEGFIIDYGRDWREGRAISTAFIESMVNALLAKRFVKKQQMQWTHRGAHLLLQIRVKVANRELRDAFRRWYPDFDASTNLRQREEVPAAAA